jgi:ribosomal protein S27AE
MIELSLPAGFLAYLVATLAAAGVLAAYDQWRAAAGRWNLSEARVCRCPACNLSFIMHRHQARAACPRCGRACLHPKR